MWCKLLLNVRDINKNPTTDTAYVVNAFPKHTCKEKLKSIEFNFKATH